jgi:hypothetical protein
MSDDEDEWTPTKKITKSRKAIKLPALIDHPTVPETQSIEVCLISLSFLFSIFK